MIKVKIKKSKTSVLPEYKTKGSAGLDLVIDNFLFLYKEVEVVGALHSGEEVIDLTEVNTPIVLNPGCRVLINTGLKMEIPKGYELQIRPRSGLAIKDGITVLNSPGTIDSDYRGDVGVIVINHGVLPKTLAHGDRIAQGVFTKYETAEFIINEEELSQTKRGKKGFGSTGVAKEV